MKKLVVVLASLTLGLVASATVYRPGLVQAKFQNGTYSSVPYNFFPNGNTTPVLISNLLTQTEWPMAADKSSVATVDFAYGAKMADTGSEDYTNPWSGRRWGWSGGNSFYAYEGEIYLHAGDRITATGRFDDGSAMIVNGVTLFNMGSTSGYNSGPGSHNVFEAPANGWYPVNAYVWDWSGSKAVCGSYISGVQYNLNGLWQDFTDATKWSKLADPGNGTILRSVDTTGGYMNVGLASVDGGDVKVPASFTAVPAAAELRAYYGSNDCGSDLGKWEGFVKIADIAAGDTASTDYTIAGGASYAKIRLVLYRLAVDASDNVACTSFYEVGNLFTFEQTAPSVIVTETECTMFSVGHSILVESFGQNATSCDLHAVFADNDAYTDPLATLDMESGTVQLLTSYPFVVSNLHFGTTYYLKVEVTNDRSEKRTVTKVVETLPAPPCTTTFKLEKGGSTLGSFYWSLSAFGDGSSYASVEIEYTPSATFTEPSVFLVSNRLETVMPETRVIIRDLTPSQSYYFRLKTVNECGTVAYSDPIQFTSTATEVNRIWANTGTDMNDPASYIENLAPGTGDYVCFTEPAKTQPYLPSDMTIKGLRFCKYFGSTVTVEPTGASGYVLTGAPGAKLTLNAVTSNDNLNDTAIVDFVVGTNRVDVPIHFGGGSNAGHSLRIYGGVLDLPQNLTADGEESTLRFCGRYTGTLRVGGDNSGFGHKLYLIDTSPRFEFYNPKAIDGFTYLYSDHWGGGGTVGGKDCDKTVHIINGCGFAVTNTTWETYVWGSNDGQKFEGSPMWFPNLTFQRNGGNDNGYNVDTLVAIGRIWLNCNQEQVSIGGSQKGVFVNLGSFDGNNDQRYIYVRGGCYVAMTPAGLGSRKLVLSSCWSSSFTSMGVGFDWSPNLASDKDSDGIGCNNGDRDTQFGWAAFGGDRTITWKGDASTTFICREVSASSSSYWAPGRLSFGAKYSDGTLIFANPIDMNGNGREIYAYDGSAFVDGRIMGDISCSVADKALHKSGAGVIALQGHCNATGYSIVYEGGLLINGSTDVYRYDAKPNAFIGGTGTVKTVFIEGNGILRPGELGGTLTATGSVTLDPNAVLEIDLSDTAVGTLDLNPSAANTEYKAKGSNILKVEVHGNLTSAKTVKVMDWSDTTDMIKDTPTLFDPAKYTVSFDPKRIRSAELTVPDGESAMYLTYKPVLKPGLRIVLR